MFKRRKWCQKQSRSFECVLRALFSQCTRVHMYVLDTNVVVFQLAAQVLIVGRMAWDFQPWKPEDNSMGPAGLHSWSSYTWSWTVSMVDILISQLPTLQVAGNEARVPVLGDFRTCRAKATTCGVEHWA